MNKKEQKQLADTEHARDLAFALRWSRSTPINPDIAIPPMGDITYGFSFNEPSRTVSALWSESSRHGDDGSVLGYQRGVSLYSTRKLALQALRHAVELRCAAVLLRIDTMIAKEEVK